jgi:predicted Abi (CAAX) family protease
VTETQTETERGAAGGRAAVGDATGDAPAAPPPAPRRTSYFRFLEADFNHPAYYPLGRPPDPARYRPAATWLGRLILPRREERDAVRGALFEVHLADAHFAHLVGRTVWLRWTETPATHRRFWSVTRQVIFDRTATKAAAGGNVLPERVNNWPDVNPFESLAGSLPADEVIVRLPEPVEVVEAGGDGSPGERGGAAPSPPAILYTPRVPVQVTGRYYALVRFLGPEAPQAPGDGAPGERGDRFRVAHYDAAAGDFAGPEEVVRLPALVPDQNGHLRSTSRGIERSPANAAGWYVYGAPDAGGTFVVQALAPRALLRLRPGRVVVGREAARAYLKPKGWQAEATKGTCTTAFLCPDGADPQEAQAAWKEGDAALVIHLWGLIGGKKPEPSARTPLAWGHTSFGVARVVREPLAGELVFDVEYQQVYIHNGDGVIAGAQHWTHYTGDRQFGWLGTRPVQDVLVKLDSFTDPFDFGWRRVSALDELANQLEAMTARYRIADGRGGTTLTPVNNCSQDSNQALYAAIKGIERTVTTRADVLDWRDRNPAEAQRLDRLLDLGHGLRRALLPLGAARADWEWGTTTLGTGLGDHPLRAVGLAARSWRTLLPSVAVRAVAGVFLDHGASAYVLRTNQVGGEDPDIAPFVPNV